MRLLPTYTIVLVLVFLILACNQRQEKQVKIKLNSYPLKSKNGYRINPLNGDSVKPILTSIGDSIPTGIPLKMLGKKFKLKGPKVYEIEEQIISNPLANRYELDTIERIYLPLDTFRYYNSHRYGRNSKLLSIKNDSIPTGIALDYEEIQKKVNLPANKKVSDLASEVKTAGQLKVLDIGDGIDPMYEEYYEHKPIRGPNGSFWIGGYGLKRYDGNYVQTFLKSNGLSEDIVVDICRDANNNLWILHPSSITRFDGNHFFILDQSNGLPINISMNDIYCDSKNNILVGSSLGLIKIDKSTLTFITVNEGLYTNTIESIVEGNDNGIYLNHHRNLSFLDKQGVKNLDFFKYIDTSHFYSGFRSVHYSDSTGLWLGLFAQKRNIFNYTNDYLTIMEVVDPEKGREKVHIQPMSITEDKKGNLWMGSWVSGLFRLDNNGHLLKYNKENALNDNFILSLYFDEYENLWAGSRNNGFNILKNPSFPLFEKWDKLELNYTWQIYEHKEKIWFASRYNGLSSFNGKNFVRYHSSESNIFHLLRSIIADQKDDLWVAGNEISGIKVLRGTKVYEYSLENEGLDDYTGKNTVFGWPNGAQSLTLDKHNRIWISNEYEDHHSASIDSTMHITYYYEYPFGKGTTCSMKDRVGNLWFGGETLKKLIEGDSLIHYGRNEGMFLDNISSIFQDAQDRIWLGSNQGVCVFQNDTFSYFNENNFLFNNNVTAISQSENGEIIIVHPQGISVIHSENGHYQSRFFDLKNGLQGKSNYENSAYVDSDNTLWIGSGIGINRIDLNDLLEEKKAIPVYISELLVNEKSYSDSTIESIPFSFLPINPEWEYSQNHLTFIFNSPDILLKDKMQYSFRLNENEDWSEVFTNNSLDLRNLNQGEYNFQIKSRYEGGNWGPIEEYHFTILPPWYSTWWARSIYGAIFLIVLFSIYRFLLNRQVQKLEVVKLKEIDELKTRFFTNISHEFRTPLTLIKGIPQLLNEAFSSGNKKRFDNELKVLNRNSSHLLNLVNQLLDISKLESGKMNPKMEVIELNQFIRNVLSAYDSAFNMKDIELKFNSLPKDIFINADQNALNHICHNLLSNALKFTDEGEVDVKILETSKDRVEIQIADTGAGIERKDLEHIFDRFYQVDSPGNSEIKGTGIGLAMTKELVQMLGASIKVESEISKGTVFKIEFDTLKADESVTLNKSDQKIELTEYIQENQQSIIDEEKSNILLVEDNTDMRNYIVALLEGDYNIMTAKDGLEGYKLAAELIPDFIISDWMMPRLSGPELIQKLKSDLITSHIPCLLLTARADQQSKLEGYKHGAQAYLTKPFMPDELKLQIQTLIQSKEAIRKYLSDKPELDKTEVYDAEAEFMNKTIMIIRERLSDQKLNGFLLAKEMNLGRSQFARKVKAIMGLTITELIRKERLEKAKTLLKEGKLNVSEITYDLGFNDPAYFSRIFTQEMGFPPSEYLEKINYQK